MNASSGAGSIPSVAAVRRLFLVDRLKSWATAASKNERFQAENPEPDVRARAFLLREDPAEMLELLRMCYHRSEELEELIGCAFINRSEVGTLTAEDVKEVQDYLRAREVHSG